MVHDYEREGERGREEEREGEEEGDLLRRCVVEGAENGNVLSAADLMARSTSCLPLLHEKTSMNASASYLCLLNPSEL